MKVINRKNGKSILALAFALLFCLSASAQVFVLDGDNDREGYGSNIGNLELPDPNTGNDHLMVPVGSGSLLLVALGGAYLLHKKANGGE